jgi:hypothetical protein
MKKTVVVNGRTEERVWQVDPRATKNISGNDWLERFPQLLTKDIQEMDRSFPRWILVAGNGVTPAACPNDREYIILKDGTMQCVLCGEVFRGQISSLIWTGLLPVQITGAIRVETRIRGKIESGNMGLSYLDKGNALYIFAPIKVVYPTNWPNSAPEGYYIAGFFETLGLSVGGASHEHHMNSGSKICMFSSWHKMTICEVIQNRIAPHALAQVKIANGERPMKWFN